MADSYDFPGAIREPAWLRNHRKAGKKTCKRCGTEKTLDAFPKSKQSWDGRYAYCSDCHKNYVREWHAKNPETSRAMSVKRAKRAKALRIAAGISSGDVARFARYGLSIERYSSMLSEQDGVCAICRQEPEVRKNRHGKLDVDHCHSSGQIRGLLCNRCNMAIGLLRDDPLLAASASAYLYYTQPEHPMPAKGVVAMVLNRMFGTKRVMK
jgi:hypothetical protein